MQIAVEPMRCGKTQRRYPPRRFPNDFHQSRWILRKPVPVRRVHAELMLINGKFRTSRDDIVKEASHGGLVTNARGNMEETTHLAGGVVVVLHKTGNRLRRIAIAESQGDVFLKRKRKSVLFSIRVKMQFITYAPDKIKRFHQLKMFDFRKMPHFCQFIQRHRPVCKQNHPQAGVEIAQSAGAFHEIRFRRIKIIVLRFEQLRPFPAPHIGEHRLAIGRLKVGHFKF